MIDAPFMDEDLKQRLYEDLGRLCAERMRDAGEEPYTMVTVSDAGGQRLVPHWEAVEAPRVMPIVEVVSVVLPTLFDQYLRDVQRRANEQAQAAQAEMNGPAPAMRANSSASANLT